MRISIRFAFENMLKVEDILKFSSFHCLSFSKPLSNIPGANFSLKQTQSISLRKTRWTEMKLKLPERAHTHSTGNNYTYFMITTIKKYLRILFQWRNIRPFSDWKRKEYLALCVWMTYTWSHFHQQGRNRNSGVVSYLTPMVYRLKKFRTKTKTMCTVQSRRPSTPPQQLRACQQVIAGAGYYTVISPSKMGLIIAHLSYNLLGCRPGLKDDE